MTPDTPADPATLPEVHLSIVTYNSEAWLDGFFESLAGQRYPLQKLRISARDNGSTDGTVKRLAEHAASWQDRCRGFHVEVGENIGFGRGHNRNLRGADEPYVLVSNVDLTFEPDALTRVVRAALLDRPETACWELRQKPFEHPKIYHPATLETLWSSHACVLFRRSALHAVGGYEEALFLYGEDVELSYRLRDQGYRLRYVPSAVCWHDTYERPGQTKRAQFLGSKLANGLLRCRYGSALQIFAVPFMYLALWCIKPRFPGYYRGLLGIGWQLARDGPHFLFHRKQSDAPFPFRGWDYEQTRPGAFYALPQASPTVPLVSVVTRTIRGRGDRLREALGSLVHQTHANVEVIVVEDGSEEARELVESFRSEGAITAIRYLSIPKSGRCQAGNVGLQSASGEYLCFLDDDDLFFADHLEVLVATLEADRSIGAAYGLAFEVEARSLSESEWGRRPPSLRVTLHQRFSRALLWDHNYLPIQAVVFRRALWEAHGGFDEELENLEDWNLWVRYSLESDFRLAERVTSLYMVPPDAAMGYARQSVLERYRQKAAAKNATLPVARSLGELLLYAKEIERYNTIFAIPRSALRSFALQMPWAASLYKISRRIGQAISRPRSP